MPRSLVPQLDPRKRPVQARSAASVAAILEATIQVLLSVGKQRVTTTRVAARAGVSVGTLYQYFPNKSALLQAVLSRHLDEVAAAVQSVCLEQQGGTLEPMARALIDTFLEVKMRDVKTSVTLYSVSSDVDGAQIAQRAGAKSAKAIAAMLASASEPLAQSPAIVASVLLGVMTGVSRQLLESSSPEKQLSLLREELSFLVTAYLHASRKTP